MSERDELLEEIERLQQALNFWLPSGGPDTPEEVMDRIGHDAYLLTGYEGPVEYAADVRGWISLRPASEVGGSHG